MNIKVAGEPDATGLACQGSSKDHRFGKDISNLKRSWLKTNFKAFVNKNKY